MLFLQVAVHAAAAVHQHLFPPELFQALDRRRSLPCEDGLHDDGVRRGELVLAGPCLGIGEPFQDVDVAAVEPLEDLPEIVKLDLDLHTHNAGDGPGEVDDIAGRLAVFVQELVWRVVAVTANDDDAQVAPRYRLGIYFRDGQAKGKQQQKESGKHNGWLLDATCRCIARKRSTGSEGVRGTYSTSGKPASKQISFPSLLTCPLRPFTGFIPTRIVRENGIFPLKPVDILFSEC